jgi:hypothetical protein
VPSYTPAIKVGGVDVQPDRVAATAEEKGEIFTAQAFPPQARDDRDIRIPNTRVSYRVISLLSCLGKVVERVVGTWIASFCETREIFHRGQFGYR